MCKIICRDKFSAKYAFRITYRVLSSVLEALRIKLYTLSAKMKIFTFIILMMVPFSSTAEECEISGKAILWAYDACFWEHETDDSIHPGVIDCVEKGQKLIKRVGTCEAKRELKLHICAMAKKWKIEDIDPKTCMSSDRPLGPAVRDGGI